MADSDLQALLPELQAIPSDDVVEPWMPMAVVLQEANDLAAFIAEPAVRSVLLAVGVPASTFERLPQAIGAARAAQSAWIVARDRSKSGAQQQREQAAESARSELLATARFALRDDPTAMAVLQSISEGEGTADLVQDLSDLPALIEQKSDAFAADKTFDLPAAVENARSLGSELAAGLSDERLDSSQAEAKQLRDRAHTHLVSVVSSVRQAGKYAFRKDPKALKHFASEYVRRQTRAAAATAAQRKAAAKPTPEGGDL